MKESIKKCRRAGIVVSLTAAALIAPEVILAGPGCMKNQTMARGYYPHSPMGPQAGYYGQRMPYRYNAAPGSYPGMMAAPYSPPMSQQQGMPAMTAAAATQPQQPTPSGASSDSKAAGESVTVRINGMRFEPASITVKPGTTVTWIHEGRMPHTISGNADGLGSSTLYNGQAYSHTFKKDGLYNYYCGIHPSMTGSVVVEEAGTDS